MKALWKVCLYNRYGKTKELGCLWHEYESVPAVNRKYKGILLEGQPTTVGFDIVERTYPVEVKCCVCGCHIRWAGFTSKIPDRVSHGYCEHCLEIEMKKIEEYKKENI